ncbi:MAG: HAD family hydrolase [Candidatus Microsaccharimonas sossegonensis]|uniref:HAD family hydrolase n=1 Tax=Candidatus Microsaccharimonas sossegonensis TaxID=2506948 RepID=A0A4V1J7E7_9BACT|nr:MAG: HAD family hydrolase [Candidatus Microsaccharimonas sossegonensis]
MIKAVIFDCFGVVLDIMRGTKIEQTIKLIKELKGQYKLAMLTNVPSRYALDQRFNPGELDQLFDVIVASGEVGWDKPAPEIYIMTVEKLAVEPEECLFIDDIPSFTKAAAALGIKTFTYVNVPESITAITAILHDNE